MDPFLKVSNKKYAVVLLCRNIYEVSLRIFSMISLLEKYAHYDFYAIIDNNHQKIDSYLSKYIRIKLLQIQDVECYQKGYHHMTFSIQKTPVSWDKAIYYFSEVCLINYDYYWFIEDDVLIPDVLTLYHIDQKYEDGNYHLLSQSNRICFSYDEPSWQWYAAKGHVDLPLFSSLLCACRISQNLLHLLRDYARKNQKLFFLEIMIPTLCCQNQLPNKVIPELSTIVYRKDWKVEEVDKAHLYHPMKDLNLQKSYFQKVSKLLL